MSLEAPKPGPGAPQGASGVVFTYALGQEVLLEDLGLWGRVTGLMVDREGHSYRVVYWADSTRHVEWVYSFEIKQGR